ncbi:GNAT family N-acetyltransferase [Streptomyces sp. NPDC101160]|uniref:GNAT family N-acetyltransferase n=1 Tax=Streptomyces sp. NPDC101160 TaxID=3366118 RepID=UPI0038175B74
MLKHGRTTLDPDWLAPLRQQIADSAPEVVIWIEFDSAGHLALSKLIVPSDLRNQGLGTRVMQLLTAEADRQGVTMTGTPSGEFGASSVHRLRRFYGRFGFSVNGGRTKDYTTAHSMIRRHHL